MSYKVVSSPVLYPETVTVGKSEKVLDTHVNLEWLLSHFRAEIKHNRMTRRREIVIPDHYTFPDDIENNTLSRIDYLATINYMPTKKLDQHLDFIADQNPYHPIVECMKDNPWDGIPRLDNFISQVVTDEPEHSKRLIKTWMVAAMAAAHSITGFINQGVLVLQGEQNIGKTSWVKALDPINCGAVKESAFLDPSNKDSVFLLSNYWIAELGELESIFRKSDIGRLKSFVTTEFDNLRLPYARKSTRVPRRSVYVATVNDKSFLADDTGNRRWWTIRVKEINRHHNLDMIQVWAEVYDVWQSGHLTYLDREIQAQVNENNKKHEKLEPLKELLFSFYDWKSTARRSMTATAVLIELGFKNPSRADATKMGRILKEVNNIDTRIISGYTLHEMPYFLPHKI